jgi:hypothetical protein
VLSDFGRTVSHTWLLNTGSGGYESRASDSHQHSGVAQMKVLHGLMSRPNIMTSMLCRILECREDHAIQVRKYGHVVPSEGEDE